MADPVQVTDAELPRLGAAERVVAVKGGGYFPVMVRLRGGKLVAVLRGGAPHLGRAGRLDWIESTDGGRNWSAPRTVVDSEWDDRNPALGQMRNGTLVLAYGECTHYDAAGNWDTSRGGFDLFYVLSKDGGKTWSPKRPLFKGPLGNGCSPYGRIIVLKDGTALMSVYGNANPNYEGPGKPPAGSHGDMVGVVRSRDNGETWSDWSLISATDHNETALLQNPSGEVLAAMRNGNSYVDVSSSTDGGRTWSAPRQVTGDGGRRWAEHPADMVRLRSGKLLMVTGRRHAPLGAMALMSPDNGLSWDYAGRVLVGWNSVSGDCGYPSVVQNADGSIVCLYYSVGTTEAPGLEQAIAVRFTEKQLREAAAGR